MGNSLFRIVCAICGKLQKPTLLYPATFSERDLNLSVYSARRLPDRIHYQIMRCERCGLIFSSPILLPEKIAKLYRKSTCTYDRQIPYLTKTYLDLFNSIQISHHPKILEVGCGNGFFLDALLEQGITDVYGVEPGSEMVVKTPKRIRKRIVVDIFKKNQFPKSSFEVICCFHTLDHLTDPKEFITTAFTILKPGGVVLVVVHDTDGISVKLIGERSPIFDIEHIYLFNKVTLRRIFAENGFDVLQVKNLINTYPLSYWLRMSGFPNRIKHFCDALLKLTKTTDIPLSVAGGNIYLVARRP